MIQQETQNIGKLISPARKLGALVRILCNRHKLKNSVQTLANQATDCDGSIEVILEYGSTWPLCGIDIREELTNAFEQN